MSERHVIRLPQLGESVTEATVTRWTKAVGDNIGAGEVIVEVSTDKVDTEVESPFAGVLIEISAPPEQTVQVGEPLAVVGSAEKLVNPSAPTPVAQIGPERSVGTAPQSSAQGVEAPPLRTALESAARKPQFSSRPLKAFLSPLVRHLAAERGFDTSALRGTGQDERITKADVLSAWERAQAATVECVQPRPQPTTVSAPPEVARGETRPLSRLRRLIAQRMVESLATSAQLTSMLEVDVSNVVRLRSQIKHQFDASERIPLTFLPFFAKATIETLREFPMFNASLDMGNLTARYESQQHLAIAVDTERGLVAPVIRDAGDLSITGLSRAIADCAARARSNSLRPDELAGGTFTLTNTGSRGALFDTPIINQPQVAILGTGMITKRPVVATDRNGSDSIAIRSMMYLSLTYDHRLIDGADAARFLVAVKARLESASLGRELLCITGRPQ